MRLVSISLRNLRVRALSTVLTTISIAIGTLLLAGLWMMIAQTEQQYRDATIGYTAIVGAKAESSLDLVLSTVYNVSSPNEKVPFSVYKELKESRGKVEGSNKQVIFRYVIPQARGADEYKGFPIVGTTGEMFSEFHFRVDAEKNPIPLAFAEGRTFGFLHDEFEVWLDEYVELVRSGGLQAHDHSDPNHSHDGDENLWGTHRHGDEIHYGRYNEAVVGYEVARKLGLGLGSPITPLHGKADDPGAHEHIESMCQVVGVLERTGTPVDRVIYVPLAVFLSMSGHEAIHESADIEVGNVGLTAIVCRGKRPNHDLNLRYSFEARRDAKAVFTRNVIDEFLKNVGNATDALRVVSLLVLLVAAVSVLVALYNTMNERRREIAIMRSLGARASQIMAIVLGEAALVSLAGAVLGVVACHGVAALMVDWVADQSGVVLDWAAFSPDEIWLILGVTGLGCLAGVLPAFKGSRTEVAENLGPIS